jgi:hypothetical protein
VIDVDEVEVLRAVIDDDIEPKQRYLEMIPDEQG